MDIEKILNELTSAEKATLLTGKKNWWMNGVPRLGIRDFMVGDGPHGLRAYKDPQERGGYPETRMPATAFPSASLMSSTWNVELIKQVGQAIGEECNHYQVDVILGPGVDGKRSPLGGRNFEYYSEDPVLTGRIATAFVKGAQSTGIGTSVKHYLLNEQESSRRFASSEVDLRTLRELYAKPFEMIIKDADPLTIMGAYNKVNGVYACQSPFALKELLRDAFGFRGLAISDWGGVQDKRASVLAGLDIEMPQSEWKDAFIQEVVDGKYPMDVIDAAVRRILSAYDRLLQNPNRGKPADFERHHELARAVAREGIVLLKNDCAILPLANDSEVLVLGTFAAHPRMNGGGSAELKPYRFENPFEAIRAICPAAYLEGYEATAEIVTAARKAKTVLIFTGTTPELESEGHDRVDMRLPDEQYVFVERIAAANPRTIVVNASGSAIETARITACVPAFVQSWFGGSACGVPIADILFGLVNPSGRLSETFPMRLENTPAFPDFPAKLGPAVYREGLFTGYRYYDTHKIPVAFPFGFGLSYTEFRYSGLTLSKPTVKNGETLQVTLTVKNVGSNAGKETVQLYLQPRGSRLISPEKTLKAFAKIDLRPGEEKQVAFSLSDADFASFIAYRNAFLVEKGVYGILVGASVSDIRAEIDVTFDSIDATRPRLSLKHPANEWLSVEPERSLLREVLKRAHRELRWWEYEDPVERIVARMAHDGVLSASEHEETVQFLSR